MGRALPLQLLPPCAWRAAGDLGRLSAEAFALEAESQAPTWFESSPGARRAHCPRCGTPMFFESTRWPGEFHVARSLIEGALDKEPSAHVFYETHVSWLDVQDSLPKKESTSGS